MSLIEYIEPIIRLLLASGLGALIGYERESQDKPVGVRTHVLISLASCLMTLVSMMEFPEDPVRLLAQIIPGIGFIGAGAIIASGGRVTGITTASGVFITAAIGIAVGTGNYVLAFVSVGITFLFLTSKEFIER